VDNSALSPALPPPVQLGHDVRHSRPHARGLRREQGQLLDQVRVVDRGQFLGHHRHNYLPVRNHVRHYRPPPTASSPSRREELTQDRAEGGGELFSRRRQRHRWENSLAVGAFAAGLIAFVTGAIRETHLVAVCVGALACLIGLYSQLVSATTGERWINVLGIGLGFVGVALGLAHGGFTL
jgi:hypothetical protein